jgi:hypothetical protein
MELLMLRGLVDLIGGEMSVVCFLSIEESLTVRQTLEI